MILIVGLGNPGKKYEKTRHNVGFRVVDLLAERWGFDSREDRFGGELNFGRRNGRRVMLLKPQTYMNLSGSSVIDCARYHEIAAEDVWLVHDDLDLPLGHMRIRPDGGSGGHRGVKSVIESLETKEFTRFRIGIGRPSDRVPVENYVVQPFGRTERKEADAAIERAADAVETAFDTDLTHAMNMFNK